MDKRTIKDINQKDMNGVLYDLFLSYEKLSDRNEKLASAIFLLSDHIKDNEPVKSSLRQNATELITSYAKNIPIKRTFSEGVPASVSVHGHATAHSHYSFALQIDKVHRFYDSVFQHISALTALITVGQRAGMISLTNAEIMNQNLKSTLQELQLVYSRTVSPVSFDQLMGNDFMATPLAEIGPRHDRALSIKKVPSAYKTHPSQVTSQEAGGGTAVRAEASSAVVVAGTTKVLSQSGAVSQSVQSHANDRISQDEKVKLRQQQILDFIKGHPASTISDIIAVVNDYSEKTVQRELINLIGQNLLRREGERRWSRYSVTGSI